MYWNIFFRFDVKDSSQFCIDFRASALVIIEASKNEVDWLVRVVDNTDTPPSRSFRSNPLSSSLLLRSNLPSSSLLLRSDLSEPWLLLAATELGADFAGNFESDAVDFRSLNDMPTR